MKVSTGGKASNTEAAETKGNTPKPTRRQFLQRTAGAGLAMAGSAVTAWANTHPHPSPQSLTYLDRRTYIRNMEVIAHILPGKNRGGKMQMMSVGSQRYLFQQGDVFDVSDLRHPQMYNEHGLQGGQVQRAGQILSPRPLFPVIPLPRARRELPPSTLLFRRLARGFHGRCAAMRAARISAARPARRCAPG